jgi:hypothetical protein
MPPPTETARKRSSMQRVPLSTPRRLKYGLTPAQARALAEAGEGQRGAVMSTLSSRLYSAAPEDKFVHMVDPEAGEVYAISRPILQSQIEDNVSIIDPRELDKALKGATQNRLLERAAGSLATTPRTSPPPPTTRRGLRPDGCQRCPDEDHASLEGRGAHAPGLPGPCADRLTDAPHARTWHPLPTCPRLATAFKGEGKYLLSKRGRGAMSLARSSTRGSSRLATTRSPSVTS